VLILYNLLITLLAPIWVPVMLVRTFRRKERPNWSERSGNFELSLPAKSGRPRLWVHAVSVGEVIAVRPILKEIRKRLPEMEIVLSVTTSSGHQTAREGDRSGYDHLVYFPMDIPRFQLRAMQRVQPVAVLVMETELWMNFLWAAKVFDAATILINGRISDRSYPRGMKVRFFYRALLKNLDLAMMQTHLDAERIRALGAADVEVLGNSKFDQATEGSQKTALSFGVPRDRPILVIGSTRGEPEETLVLAAVQKVGFDRLTVIHAPRHIEDAPGLISRVRSLTPDAALRSLGETGRYIVLDTYGELAACYPIADIVVVGGGFQNLGGQNIVQPLAAGKPLLHGPHMQNFRQAAELADKAGAARTCATADELAAQINLLLGDKELREAMGEAGAKLVQENLGASRRYAEAVAEYLEARH
jgi:3-deoxy-D-manno-octulosonic-acid transferase